MLLSIRKQVLIHQTGGAQAGINDGDVKNLYIVKPSLQEQTQIARYLDYQTCIIDELLKKKEKLIELLKEKRQAIINEAVTKGLNPKAKMKDSGIEWLGEVPDEWQVLKLKFISDTKFSSVDRHEYDEENKVGICHYPYAYKNEKINKKIELAKGTCSDSELEKYLLKKGQIILTKDSETANDIGVPAYVEEDIPNTVCGYHLAMVETKREYDIILSEFLFRYFQTSNVNRYFELNSNGVTRFGLGKSSIENLFVPIPTIKAQRNIITYINNSIEHINKCRLGILNVIEKLKEYRQSIISEAVTGKIDVREWQPNNK
jgi:type I restriction enzyme S subunit